MRTLMDEDERQEYICLKLEGYSDEEARKLARAANNSINSERLSGPRAHDRGGHGAAPLMTDYMWTDLWEATTPVTLDTRDAVEREDHWAMQDRARDLLDLLTPVQRQVVVDLYGLETGTPMSYAEVGDKHGHSASWTGKTRHKALARIRRMLAEPSAEEKEKARKARKREYNRQWVAKKREEVGR